jgi:pimeloyl-ACP methyl ester carboxylesterase
MPESMGHSKCNSKTGRKENNMSPIWKETTLVGGIHGLTAGSGPPVVLLPGWPETAEAYSQVFARLAERYQVFALNPPGLGESEPAAEGYDTANVAKVLSTAVKTVTHEPIHLVGHDVGGWIAYAWAAQFPEQIKSLTLLDTAVPGTGAPQTFPLPPELNVKLWQFSFNTLPELPETLTAGRERELFDWLFKQKTERLERIPQSNRDRYVEAYARPGAMSRGFAYYRAVAESAKQNQEFSKTKLSVPVLALGGSSATGERLKGSMESLALHVEGGVIENCGHYVMEEQPEIVTERLLGFFDQVEARP